MKVGGLVYLRMNLVVIRFLTKRTIDGEQAGVEFAHDVVESEDSSEP